ncbi:MAG: outer-membrane lipoprotein carrier protein LolA [Bacteroidales bacterium]|nr:outer-membrane lipoprotein carrier protein LolA [Bacteroidales bacterium]
MTSLHPNSRLCRLLPLLLSLLFMTPKAWCADSASDILAKAANKISTAKSITASFLVNQDGATTSGSLTLAGDKFHIYQPQLTVWYDGKTQWAYLPASSEVDISTPTDNELEEVNPLSLLNRFQKRFIASKEASAAGTYKIALKSRQSDDPIGNATLTLDASTLQPKSIVLKLVDGRQINVSITSFTYGGALPDSTFKFDKAKYPGVEIVDLRD